MPPLAPTFIAQPNPSTPGRVKVRGPFDRALSHRFYSIPGCKYLSYEGAWLLPEELLGTLPGEVAGRLSTDAVTDGKTNPRLHGYQRRVTDQVLVDHAGFLNWETGTGKTATALEVARLNGAESVLILCPASVRLHWVAEIQKWWDRRVEPCAIRSSGDAEDIYELPPSLAPPVVVCSYALAHTLWSPWDCIILDESHLVKNEDTDRGEAVKEICRANPDALKIALTATPIADRPKDLWNQLDCIWPGRFGSEFEFVSRYSHVEANEYSSFVPKGLDGDYAAELEQRLGYCTSRVTKADVADLLPPLHVVVERIERNGYVRHFAVGDALSRDALEGHINLTSDLKIEWVLEQAALIKGRGEGLCIFTHLRSTARRIAEVLGVPHITGDLPMESRNALIKEAQAARRPVVATMHSVGRGIDTLAWCDVGIFAELYWQPEIVIQAMGRLHRLSSLGPRTIYLPVLEGTVDELMADALLEKVSDMNALIPPGTAEGELGEKLKIPDWSDEEFFAAMRRAAASGRVA